MSSFRLVFDLEDYSEFVNLNRFQFFHTAISGFTLAIATDRHLILTDGVNDGINQQEATIRVVLEFNEDSIRATALSWITDDIICVGFESGYVVCFNCLGEEVFEYRGNKSSVQSLRFSHSDVNGKGPGIWILYELGYLVSIPLAQVLKGKSDFSAAFKLAEHITTNDFVFCPTIYSPSIFETNSDADKPSYTVLVSGMNSALSLYNLGGKLHFQDFDKLAGYTKDRVTSLISKSFMSLFSSLTASSTDAQRASKTDKSDEYLRVEERCVTLTSQLDLQDAKRRILRLSVEPYGTLVAAADSLGRVTLYDTQTNCVVRMWKGLRDARLAWTHAHDSGSTSLPNDPAPGWGLGGFRLHLVVYAPQLGLVSVYRMSLGVCVRIVPAGLNGQLLTIMDETASGHRVAKCFLLRALGEGGSAVEMVEINPVECAESDIDVHSSLLSGTGAHPDSAQAGDEGYDSEAEGMDRAGHRIPEARILLKSERILTNLAEVHGNLSRAAAVASARHIEISARCVDEDLVSNAEKHLLELLSCAQLSLRGMVRVLRLVETVELFGSCQPASVGGFASGGVHVGKAHSICFSASFHGKLTSLLNESLNHRGDGAMDYSADRGDSSATLRELVTEEVKLRGKLLQAFEGLQDIHANSEYLGALVPDTAQNQQQSYGSPMNVTPIASADETAAMCKANSSRAEALCWALRASKKSEKSALARLRVKKLQDDPHQISPKARPVGSLTPTQHSVGSAEHMLRKFSPRPDSSGSTPPRGGLSSHTVKKALMGGGAREGDPDSVSPAHSRTASVATNASFVPPQSLSDSLLPDPKAVNFSVFRALHQQFFRDEESAEADAGTTQGDWVCRPVQLRSQELLRLLEAADRELAQNRQKSFAQTSQNSLLRKTAAARASSDSVSLSPALSALQRHRLLSGISADAETTCESCASIRAESIFQESAPNIQEAVPFSLLWSPRTPQVVLDLLSLLVSPLQGDLFAMNSFAAATKQMGANGFEGVRQLLPLYLSFLTHRPASALISEVLTKKLSTSPFQRWLRDTLLTFQDTIAASARSVFDKITDEQRPSSGTDAVSNLAADLAEEEVDGADGDLSSGPAMSRSNSFGDEADSLSALTRQVLADRRVRTSKRCPEPESQDDELREEEPSYDEFVRCILRPAWLYARSCTNLEAVMAFAAVVLETLSTVHEQVERRTYGASNLSMTIAAWENLVRQVRVSLLLSSRVGLEHTSFSVARLSSGVVSLHRLLAADTLCFAVRADQALEHEERCQEVFKRRIAMSSSSGVTVTASDSARNSDVLIAWGKVADKRWRDLIAVAVAEDSLDVDGSGAVKQQQGAEDEDASGDETSPQKKRAPPVRRRRPLLLYFPQHSQQRFLGAHRSLILAERWVAKAHQVEGLSLVSEHLFSLPPMWRGAVAAHIYLVFVLPYVRMFVSLEEDSPQNTALQTDDAILQSDALTQATKTQLLVVMTDIASLKTFVRSAVEILRFVEAATKHSGDSPDERPGSEKGSATASDAFHEETAESMWPPTSDQHVSAIFAKFVSSLAQWTSAVLDAHISTLWVMQLRFQCGLRGIKPSAILGGAVLGVVCGATATSPSRAETLQSLNIPDGDAQVIQLEFLNQCLRRLVSVDPPVVAYKLAELWRVNLDRVRLLHIAALLDTGSLDDEADLLVPQVKDSGAVVDAITACLRVRIGHVIARIDRLPLFAPVLAAMDAEAVSWTRKALPAEFSPDSAVLEDIARGRAKAVNLNLASTRHLVISLQGILLAVPVTERYHGAEEGGNSWLERKGKCDALLSLCNSFSHLNSFHGARGVNK